MEHGKTRARPVNVLEEQISETRIHIRELENQKLQQDENRESEKVQEQEIESLEANKKCLEDFKKILSQEEFHNEKIHMNEELQQANKNKIIVEETELEKAIKENNEENLNNKEIKVNNKKYLAIFILIILISVFAIQSMYIKIGFLIAFAIYVILDNMRLKKRKKEYVGLKEKYSTKINIIKSKIEILENNNKELQNTIQALDNSYEIKINEDIEKWKSNFLKFIGNEELEFILENINNENIECKISAMQNKINEVRIAISRAKIKEEANQKIEQELITEQENLGKYELNKQELLENYNLMEETKNILEEAYEEMKKRITPVFIKELSNNMQTISNGKYKNIKLTEKEGIVVEQETGELIPISRFSVGTIDQLYLSLRMATINEITSEKIPLFFDETFVYFDDHRLSETLLFLNETYYDRQVIIFTCTNRERELLERQRLEYNLIEV